MCSTSRRYSRDARYPDSSGASRAAARRAVFPVVMGPTAELRGLADRLVCATLNRSLVRASRTHGFQFVDVLHGWDRTFSLPDGTHLTVEGHRHVADRLFATLGPRVATGETDDGRASSYQQGTADLSGGRVPYPGAEHDRR